MNVMTDMIMQKGEKYDSVRYYDVIVWSCIVPVKGKITLLYRTVVRGQLSIVVNSLITD